MVPVNSIVRCPWCMGENTLQNWEDTTKAECTSRETRRAYRSLTNESVWKKESKNFYKCPNCNQWSRGNKLKIIRPSDKRLDELGGESLFEIRSHVDNAE